MQKQPDCLYVAIDSQQVPIRDGARLVAAEAPGPIGQPHSPPVSAAMPAPLASIPVPLPMRLVAGQCVLIDPALAPACPTLEVVEGIARVFCPCPETGGMTLAFLQPGDQLRIDRLCSEGVCLEALTSLCYRSGVTAAESSGFDAVNEWTLQLLRIRHLGSAEQRLHALLSLLVRRLGRRCGAWCDLPFRLTHDRIAELIGTTRVTTTRLLSRIRRQQLLCAETGQSGLRLAPALVESAPLAA